MLEPEVLISRAALVGNLRALLKDAGGRALFPVLKANAYGHGMDTIAQIIEANFSTSDLPYFCVARLSEAFRLRRAGIRRSILVLSQGIDAEACDSKELEKSSGVADLRGIEWVVNSLEDFRILDELAAKSPQVARSLGGIHLNFNTGMNRLGFASKLSDQDWSELMEAIAARRRDGVGVTGLMSHLARGEETPATFSDLQLRRFEALAKKIRELWVESLHGEFPKWMHLENSGGLGRRLTLKKSIANAARPGLHVWGLEADLSAFASLGLQKVMQVRAPLRQLFWAAKGEAIGYGGSHVCQECTLVGTFNLGYADGIFRTLSGHDEVGFVVDGARVPIAGKVSMDLVSLDLSRHPRSTEWAEGLVGGRQPRIWAYWICPQQSAQKIAEALGTISYEVVCAISQRVPRKILEDQRP